MEKQNEGYEYKANDLGQVVYAGGQLKLEEGERDAYAQRTVGGEYRRENDDGGHLIGTRFAGSGKKENLVPEDKHINRGSYKSLENWWADNHEKGNDVYVEVEPVYHGASSRPDVITAKTEIFDGEKKEVDYYSMTNENLESEEFSLPEEADEMLELWEDEEEKMAKTLVLKNDYYRDPTKEELMASGEKAIDQYMEILRDEMRSDGMEDGPEMEAIISRKREESMTELRNGVYGTNSQAEESDPLDNFVDGIDNGINDTVDEIDDGIDSAIDRVDEGIEHTVNEIDDSIDEGIDKIDEGIEHTVDEIDDGIDSAIDRVDEGIENAVDGIDDGIDQTVDGIDSGIDQMTEGADNSFGIDM